MPGRLLSSFVQRGGVTVVGPNNTPWTRNYDAIPFTYRYGGSWNSQDEPVFPFNPPASYGSVTCSGQITVTMTWKPTDGDDDDTPPPYVMIVMDSTANWSGDSGNCANGLDHSPVPNPPLNGYQQSSGISYELVAGKDEIIRYITPTAYALVNNPALGESTTAVAGVSIKYTAVPIEIKLTGVLHPDKDRRILIGQTLGAYVSIGGLPMGNNPTYEWDVSGGDPFQEFVVNYVSGQPESAYVDEFSPQTTEELSTHLRTHSESPYQVTCTFYWPWRNTTLELTEDVLASKPSASTSVETVFPDLYAVSGSTYVQTMTDPDATAHRQEDPFVPGIEWIGDIETPSVFGGGGSWAIVQLITPGRERDGLVPFDTRPEPGLPAIPINGLQGLDKVFPYPGFPPYSDGIYPADGTPRSSNDNPQEPVIIGLLYNHWVDVLDSFDTYYFYKPPGTYSQWVPLRKLDWYWESAAHCNAGVATWVWDARGAAWSYSGSFFPPHPEWTYRHDTHIWVYR